MSFTMKYIGYSMNFPSQFAKPPALQISKALRNAPDKPWPASNASVALQL